MPSILHLAFFGLAIVLIGLVNGQGPCNPSDDPTCAMAWPPGKHGIGSAYLAVGAPNAPIKWASMQLRLPEKGTFNGSAMALNPSFETNVRSLVS